MPPPPAPTSRPRPPAPSAAPRDAAASLPTRPRKVVLEKALQANKVPYLRLGSGKEAAAIARFQAEPGVQALLLPVARGANGLNLVAASHVLLLEPLMDPGAEAQAVKRVDRIGQARATCVHRFIVAETVEEHIHSLYAGMVTAACDAGGVATGERGGQPRGGRGRRGLRAADLAHLLQ